MAKIRINGDTSGYIELSAPAVAGSTSITLPATTGGSLLATDANGNLNVDSGVLYVDGVNNRVGIGTTSPESLVHIDGNATAFRITRGSSIGFAYNTGTAVTDPFRIQSNGGAVDLFSAVSQPITFSAGTSEKARIDGSGRFLVGASSTSATCNVLLQTNGGTAGTLVLAYGNTSPADGQDLGFISFNDSSHIYNSAIIRATRDGGTWTSGSSMPTRLTLWTTGNGSGSPTERMRISQAGYAKFGITGSYEGGNIYEFNGGENGGACCVVRWTPSGLNSGNGFIVKTPNTAAATTHNFYAGDTSAGTVYRVRADGNVYNTNGVYGSISDVTLKENIVPASSQWADIKALQVRKYNFKEGLTHTQIGVIAQEVELVSPGLVYNNVERDKDGNETGKITKGVNYSVLYMKSVKALQEAMERIEQLEATNASFEARLSALEVKP